MEHSNAGYSFSFDHIQFNRFSATAAERRSFEPCRVRNCSERVRGASIFLPELRIPLNSERERKREISIHSGQQHWLAPRRPGLLVCQRNAHYWPKARLRTCLRMVINVTTVTYAFRHRVYLSASPFNPYLPLPLPALWSLLEHRLFSGRTRACALHRPWNFVYERNFFTDRNERPQHRVDIGKTSRRNFSSVAPTYSYESIVIEMVKSARIRGMERFMPDTACSNIVVEFNLLVVNDQYTRHAVMTRKLLII